MTTVRTIDQRWVQWLARSGYGAEWSTEAPPPCDAEALAVEYARDEYPDWSDDPLDNIVSLAANVPGWDVRGTDDAMRRVVYKAAHRFGVTAKAVMGKDRDARTARARAVTYWLLRNGAGIDDESRPLAAIGLLVDRDHSTVLYGVRRVEEDPALRSIAMQLMIELVAEEMSDAV